MSHSHTLSQYSQTQTYSQSHLYNSLSHIQTHSPSHTHILRLSHIFTQHIHSHSHGLIYTHILMHTQRHSHTTLSLSDCHWVRVCSAHVWPQVYRKLALSHVRVELAVGHQGGVFFSSMKSRLSGRTAGLEAP